jgi:hypothetical protein
MRKLSWAEEVDRGMIPEFGELGEVADNPGERDGRLCNNGANRPFNPAESFPDSEEYP